MLKCVMGVHVLHEKAAESEHVETLVLMLVSEGRVRSDHTHKKGRGGGAVIFICPRELDLCKRPNLMDGHG